MGTYRATVLAVLVASALPALAADVKPQAPNYPLANGAFTLECKSPSFHATLSYFAKVWWIGHAGQAAFFRGNPETGSGFIQFAPTVWEDGNTDRFNGPSLTITFNGVASGPGPFEAMISEAEAQAVNRQEKAVCQKKPFAGPPDFPPLRCRADALQVWPLREKGTPRSAPKVTMTVLPNQQKPERIEFQFDEPFSFDGFALKQNDKGDSHWVDMPSLPLAPKCKGKEPEGFGYWPSCSKYVFFLSESDVRNYDCAYVLPAGAKSIAGHPYTPANEMKLITAEDDSHQREFPCEPANRGIFMDEFGRTWRNDGGRKTKIGKRFSYFSGTTSAGKMKCFVTGDDVIAVFDARDEDADLPDQVIRKPLAGATETWRLTFSASSPRKFEFKPPWLSMQMSTLNKNYFPSNTPAQIDIQTDQGTAKITSPDCIWVETWSGGSPSRTQLGAGCAQTK